MNRITCANNPIIVKQSVELYDAASNLQNTARLKGYIFNIIGDELAFINDDGMQLVSTYRKYEKVFHFTNSNCDASINVQTLSDMMNMRREVFTRKFKRDIGLSPKQFLDRILLHKSSQLLMSNLSIKEVAYMLNFNSEYYFSRFFKKHIGIPPKAYQLREKQMQKSST